MPLNDRHPPHAPLLLALAATLLASGCAGLPRIDPSGRRILIWPDPQPTAPTVAAPGLGNVDVPPVYAGGAPPVAGPPAPGPIGSIGAGGVPVVNTALSPVDERLAITPSRLLAPIGSEVVLKAGVCSEKGYLRTNRRIEWMLGQEGAGQFVTVGERGEMDIFRLPWQRPNKQDNAYAVGYTTPYNVCLRRGTDDPSDDVQVERGEAWITLSSASEGVSYVTATAPESKDWDARRATATVYWVDAQWRLPDSLNLQPGQTGTLTTTVTRQSDGAPVAGWLVRYEVLYGETARLGYESGQTSEVETDAQGRASVQVTPTDDLPGTAVVKVSVVRPATSAPMPAPRLELGGGEASVTWSPGAGPVTGPPITGGGGAAPPDDRPQPPAPFEPPPSGGGDTLGEPTPRVGPVLEVVVRRDSTGPIRADDPIPTTITLLNTGDEPAENLTLNVEYDRGLASPADTQGKYELTRSDLSDLAPGDSYAVDLDLIAVEPGEHCANVTVTADRAPSAFDRLCVDVERPAPPARPQLRIETALEAVRTVGETLTYLVTVYNDGSTAAEDVRIEVLSRSQLEPRQATEGWTAIPNGVAWPAERIEASGSASYQVRFDCVAPADVAEVQVYAVFGEDDYETKLDGVEIRPAAPDEPPPVRRPDLEGVLSSSANPARVGQAATLNVAITNTTGRDLQNVQYRLLFPSQLRPTMVEGASQNGNALEFPAIDVLPAGETFRFAVPYTPTEQGVVAVALQTRQGADGAPTTSETTISIGGR